MFFIDRTRDLTHLDDSGVVCYNEDLASDRLELVYKLGL